MVSPCKKKADKKGKTSVSQQTKETTSVRKENKPLAGKKFYLDIRNQTSSKKLEEQIISLGGSVETFLVSEVSYVVTDKKSPLDKGSSPHPLSTSSPSPSDAASHTTRTRSRGEAMLQRVKHNSLTQSDSDIYERAQLLGVPIYPLARFTEYVAKLLRRAERAVAGIGLRELRGSYLKLETGLRPELRVLTGGWPRLDLTRGSQGAAFATPNHDTNHNCSRMTRKSGSRLLAANTRNSSSGGGGAAGYCEVCRLNYRWLDEHLSSVGHIKAVTDPTQYHELDSLITSSAWLGPRKSLRIAKSPPPVHISPPPPTILNCNGHQANHNQVLSNGLSSRRSSERKSPRGRVVRKRLSAEEKLIEDNRAYYKVEVLNSKLRSTGNLQRQLVSSGGDKDDDDLEDIRDEEDSRSNSPPASNLRMGGIIGSSSLPNGQVTTPTDSVVVRLKKVRKSELSVLNNEAENFMFGGDKKDELQSPTEQQQSSEEIIKKKRRTHAEVFINDNTDYYKFELPGSRLRYQGTTLAHVPTPMKEDYPHSRFRSTRSPPYEDQNLTRLRSSAGKNPASPKEESSTAGHHRLRSGRSPPVEESSRSLRSPDTSHRLRSTDSVAAPAVVSEPRLRSCPGLSPVKQEPVQRICPPSEDDPAPELTLSHCDITYAFELTDKEAVWAKVRDRLDNYKEDILPHYYSYPTVVLPCEMPYLERLKLLTRRRRRISRCLDDKPRKSPRCHASTLAIMSSVLPKSRLTSDQPPTPAPPATVSSAAEDEDTTTSSMTAESVVSDPNQDSRTILQRYMLQFASLMDCAQPKATSPRPWEPPDDYADMPPATAVQQDFISMINNKDCPSVEKYTQETLFALRSFDLQATLDSCNSSDCSEIFGFSEDGRSFFGRRKKKKRHNLTGWPKEKPRRKYLGYAKNRSLKSEPPQSAVHNDQTDESSAIIENFVLSFTESHNEFSSPSKAKKRGRPRLYPPGMSPSSLKARFARENAAMRRSTSISPVKLRPSLKANPL